MAQIETVDYLRLCSLYRRTISVPIPAELVARKGTNRVARARCQRVQENLRAAVHAEFDRAARRPFRGEVAIHLALTGVSLVQALRTIKALVDSLEGPVFTDDRAVALLDVEVSPGPLAATIAACSAREYADAFDVLSGASSERDDDDDDDRLNPWAWERDALDDDHEIDFAREHLADARADTSLYSPELRAMLIEINERRIKEHELKVVFATPYLPTDRPGPPSVAGHLWNDHPHLGGPACIVLPAPDRGGGSWTRIAREACDAHFARWPRLMSLLETEHVALDIALDQAAAHTFDVDNLARRVLSAFRDSARALPSPSGYRVYRRQGDDDSVVVRLHPARRANDLRWLLGGSPLGLLGIRPDPDAPVHRRRPIDDEVLEGVRTIGLRSAA